MRLSLLSFCIFFHYAICAQAQPTETYPNKPVFPDSIINKKKIKWLKPVVIAGYTSLGVLCYRFADTRIQHFSQSNKTSLTDFISKGVTGLGLGKVQALGLGVTAVAAFVAKNTNLKKTVFVWAGSLVLNSVVTDQLKKTFQRHRPNSGDAYNVFDWRGGSRHHASFPSAHTSNAFTTATVFADAYKDKKWVAPIAYGIASLVGLSRIYDNAHWTSDVMAGAAIGFLSAKAMSGAYKSLGKKFLILPGLEQAHTSLALVYSF
ncbi:MAG TPA: phosphatase PAP2 family protein [Chryseolinea sp.]|nr:phosphatase PAP2 family protein [Chryseolinea sp.]